GGPPPRRVPRAERHLPTASLRDAMTFPPLRALLPCLVLLAWPAVTRAAAPAFFEKHCQQCHIADVKKGGLDLTALPLELDKPETAARWVKDGDGIAAGEMPPRRVRERPTPAEVADVTRWLRDGLVAAEAKTETDGRTRLRRLTRTEYENTVRDLFDLPG